MSSDLTPVLQQALKLLSSQPNVILSTLNESGYPDVRAVFNLRHQPSFPELATLFESDSLVTYISTNTHSQKVVQAAANPAASLYYFDPVTFQGLTLFGQLHRVTDPIVLNTFWLPTWEQYYPGGKDGGDYCLLKFTPTSFKYYDGGSFGKYAGDLP